jgi:hypothetical protein
VFVLLAVLPCPTAVLLVPDDKLLLPNADAFAAVALPFCP